MNSLLPFYCCVDTIRTYASAFQFFLVMLLLLVFVLFLFSFACFSFVRVMSQKYVRTAVFLEIGVDGGDVT